MEDNPGRQDNPLHGEGGWDELAKFWGWLANRFGDEDLASETLVTAKKKAATYDPSMPLQPWLFKIAISINCKARRRVMPTVEVTEVPQADSGLERLEALEEAQEALEALELCKRVLGAELWEMFVNVHVNGMTWEQATTGAGERPRTLEMRVRRRLSLVRQMLGIDEEGAERKQDGGS